MARLLGEYSFFKFKKQPRVDCYVAGHVYDVIIGHTSKMWAEDIPQVVQ